MNVLWTVNLIPRPAAEALGLPCGVLGGWVEAMAAQLSRMEDVRLFIACKSDTGLCFETEAQGVTYYSIPYTKGIKRRALKERCLALIEKTQPDLIHIEGTEFPHAAAMLEAADEKNIPAAVSMQGILNGQYGYQCGLLPIDDMLFSCKPVNVFSALTLHFRKTRWYAPRMAPEREIIEKARFILGRTTWDRAHTYALNPHAQYYACPRVLRAPFYETQWDVNTMERHTVYAGNGYYALKGFHFLVEALPELIREYPDIKIYVAGHKPFGEKKALIKKGYGAYLKQRIKSLGVGEHIVFTGPLSARDVAERLRRANAYVLASVAENSPNTLGEAMLVGTPCISAYVGGVPDMAEDGKEALFYRADDPALLTWRIKQIFDNDALACSLSRSARARAEKTHDPEKNAQTLYGVYRDILQS